MDAVEAHTAGVDDDDTAACFDLGGIGHGAKPGDDAAGEQRCTVETDICGNQDDLGLFDNDGLGEGSRSQALMDGDATPGALPALRIEREGRFTHVRFVSLTEVAATTGSEQRDDDVIAGRNRCNSWADFFDDASSLMSIHGRQCAAPGSLKVMDIAVTDGARKESDLDLSRMGRIDFDLLDDQGFPELVADGRLHDDASFPGPEWLLGAGAGDAARRRGIIFQSSLFDFIAAYHAKAEFTFFDSTKRSLDLL